MRLTTRTWIALAVLVFAASFAIRAAAIRWFPQYDYHDDLEIYRASGALIADGANPYDFADHVPLRTELRMQAHNPEIRDLSQARWDYYVSGNLPMNVLFFGALSAIRDTPHFYRYVFGFFDSLLSTLVVWFVIRYWPPTPSWIGSTLSSAGMSSKASMFAGRFGIGLVLGCFSPVLFKHGAAIPEDKGIQILLMLAAIACYMSSDERLWYWGGAALLGLSIAFKGLGIFLVPLFASRLLAKHDRVWARSFGFAAVCGVVAGVWLIPFGSSVAAMVRTRLMFGSTLPPQHASIWVVPSMYLPSGWNVLRFGLLLAMLGAALVGYRRKRVGLDMLCMTLLLGFTVVWLINGALDRQNIALLLMLLLLGSRSPKAALVCLVPYLLAGFGGFVKHGIHGQPVNFEVRETLESIGILLFTVVYLSILGWFSLWSQSFTLIHAPIANSSATSSTPAGVTWVRVQRNRML
ncbi:MAG TPA: hypothetical protein VN948_12135 [Terriglobales bacterium]|nr:hypothetical protein [Terriglobales bacterium]